MTMYWIYDLPNWLFGLLTILVFNAIAIGGLIATRPVARRLLKESGEYNDVVSWFFAAVGVFYGLAVGLIAVATWEDFTAVDGVIGKEAASLAGLYRDFDGYPLTSAASSRGNLLKQIVAVEWPRHRQGLAPDDGGEQLDALENDIMAFLELGTKIRMPRCCTGSTTSSRFAARGCRRSAPACPPRSGPSY